MAAYAALVSLEHVLDQILGRDDQDCCIFHHKQQIKSLHENIVFLVAFLDDFPQDAGALLEGHMRDAANRAEGIIESRISDEMRGDDCRCWGEVDCIRQVILGAFPTHGLKLRYWPKLHEELQNVIKEMEAIVEEAMRIKTSIVTKDSIPSHFPTSSAHGSSSSSRLAWPSPQGIVFGHDGDIIVMVEWLTGSSYRLGITPIIGIEGIGKTTLARCVYDHPLIKVYFDVYAWVTIAPDSGKEKILLDIIYSITQSKELYYHNMSVEELFMLLYKCLVGRRYFIVMDDVRDASVWNDIKRVFPDDNNGSRIIITARHLASSIYPSNHPLQMKLMDKSQSWDLLRKKVFAEEHCPPQLEQIGKFIAERCGGLPLVIVAMARILSKDNRVQETWEHIARHVNEAVNTSDERFTEVLWLSYKYLSHHLKSCLLYMVGFPPNYKISVSKLVKLWVAEGFLNPKLDRFKNLEEVAEEYLEDLIERSLVIACKKRYDGKIKTVIIRDCIRDLCLSKAQDAKFFQVISKFSTSLPDGILNSRCPGVLALPLGHIVDIEDSPIRTVLFPLPSWPFNSWQYFNLLRVLDASTLEFGSFPNEICELCHLRYLVFTFIHEGKFKIPESLLKLQNLQTLIIMTSSTKHGCTNALYLFPFGIWRLPRLRHLMLFDVCSLVPCVGIVTTLEYLHTLSRISSFTCSERMLKLMPNLNKLEIVYPLDVISKIGWSKYQLNNLVHFRILKKLNIHVERGPGPFHMVFPNHSNLLMQKCDIAFPATLKKLTLSGCLLPWQDMTIVGSLPNLEVLKLGSWACYGDDWETTDGEFCRLKVLIIDDSDPQRWITESSHFPRLQCLHLIHCCVLNEIPRCIGEIPTLQVLELDNCNPFVEKSAYRIGAALWFKWKKNLHFRF